MRLILPLFCAAGLLCGCSSEDTTYGSSVSYVYDDWLYQHHDWYDDDFWIWVDDHPDCCDDEDDIEEALQNWYDDLDPDQQRRCAIGSRPGWTNTESCPRPDSRAEIWFLRLHPSGGRR
jgi:hypothetical protein